MWGDVFRIPWSNSFPRVQTTGNPFVGFGGFYGERPRSFWEDPVYLPSEKPRRLSNRTVKKTRRLVEEDRQSDDERSIPVAREKPSDKMKEDEEQICPTQPKLSKHVKDVHIPVEIQFGDENGLNEGFEENSSRETHCDDTKQLSRDQGSSDEPVCTDTGGPHKQCVCLCSKYKEMYGRILKSLNIKINVKVPRWLCIVVSVALNGEFERFGGFCVDCCYTLYLITYSNSQRKNHQIAQIRHSEPQKRQYTATEVLLHLF